MSIRETLGLPEAVRSERRAQGKTQRELAAAVESTQSQISQFEKGKISAVSDEIATKLVEVLELEKRLLKSPVSSPEDYAVCTNPDCPGGTIGLIGKEVAVRPTFWRVQRFRDRRGRCPLCGEVIICDCEGCKAAIRPGAFCYSCGEAYVQPPTEIVLLPLEVRELRIDEMNRRNREFTAFPNPADIPILGREYLSIKD